LLEGAKFLCLLLPTSLALLRRALLDPQQFCYNLGVYFWSRAMTYIALVPVNILILAQNVEMASY